MATIDPQYEAAMSWALVEPPNVLHRISGRAELDTLALDLKGFCVY